MGGRPLPHTVIGSFRCCFSLEWLKAAYERLVSHVSLIQLWAGCCPGASARGATGPLGAQQGAILMVGQHVLEDQGEADESLMRHGEARPHPASTACRVSRAADRHTVNVGRHGGVRFGRG